jgi:peptidoglycan/LPS O-acetylase OafA/YrhL
MKGQTKISQLDSIRGLSFLAIFIFHTIHPLPGNNLIGNFFVFIYDHLPLAIDVFFVLSAFLLTWLGINEYKQKGSFSFKNYFIRRVLRIWPLYYIILAIAFILIPLITSKLHVPVSLPDPLWYIFFVSNFYYIDHVFFLRFLWTISAEEQFYLILGTCLKFLSPFLLVIFLIMAMTSISFSCYCLLTGKDSYTNVLTWLIDFAAGGIAACMLFRSKGLNRFFANLPLWSTAIFYSYLLFHFIFLYIIDLTLKWDKGVVELVSRYLFIIYLGFFILEQIVNKNRTKVLEKSKFLTFTGRISYGLYCFHGLVLTFFTILFKKLNYAAPDVIFFSLAFLFTYLLATLSFRYLESPFLKLKERFRNTRINQKEITS